MNRDDSGHQSIERDRALRALAYELKHPLIRIARQAELGRPDDYPDIQQAAEQALMLIDGYLLHAQTEYGQIALDLSPTSVGSVLYDASTLMHQQAVLHNASFEIDNRTSDLVMTHRTALNSIMSAFGSMLIGFNTDKNHQRIVLRGYRTRAGKLGIGMFSNINLSQIDLQRALQLQGNAHMPLSKLSSSAHVSLSIADGLCRAIGGALQVKHMGKLSGLATELPRSEQLALV